MRRRHLSTIAPIFMKYIRGRTAFGAPGRRYLILFSVRPLRQSENYRPICFATSSAKFSCFFSMPSPVSSRIKLFTVIGLPTSFDT